MRTLASHLWNNVVKKALNLQDMKMKDLSKNANNVAACFACHVKMHNFLFDV